MPSGINWHKKHFMKKLNLIAALLIAASSAFAQVPSYVPTNGLVGWWPFNGNANDESGNNYTGIVSGAILTTDRFGIINAAYSFNGINDYIQTNAPGITGTNSRSISFWIKTSDLSIQTPIDYYGGSGSAFQPILNSPCAGLGIDGATGVVTRGGANLINNQWHHCVLVFDNQTSFTISDVLMYIDGNIQSTITCSALNANTIVNTTTSANFVFGKTTSNVRFLNGLLDDIGMWNRALTQQEITVIYNGCGGTGSVTADGPTTFCAGNSVNLKSDVVGGTYQWRRNGINITTNATSRTFKASTTGSYTCVATCNGTTLTSNAIAVTSKTNAATTVSASGATSFCAGDSVTLNATNLGSNYSVQWYRTNVSMENATNYSQVVKQPGTYKVVTKNLTNGCSRISGSAITTNVNCRTANNNQSEPTSNDINEEARTLAPELSQGVNLFPNPNNGSFKFTYEGEVEGEGTIQVISAMGQVIYQSQATAEDGRISKEIFLGDQYQKGIYIVRLLINGGQNDSRMIVQ
jgi:hypothetical protein